MRIHHRDILVACYTRHPDSKSTMESWYSVTKIATWKSPNDIKARFPTASILRGNRVVFNVSGNRYRLVAVLNYNLGIVEIRFADTHAEYDKIDAERI